MYMLFFLSLSESFVDKPQCFQVIKGETINFAYKQDYYFLRFKKHSIYY